VAGTPAIFDACTLETERTRVLNTNGSPTGRPEVDN
jgi:hypothetical protein